MGLGGVMLRVRLPPLPLELLLLLASCWRSRRVSPLPEVGGDLWGGCWVIPVLVFVLAPLTIWLAPIGLSRLSFESCFLAAVIVFDTGIGRGAVWSMTDLKGGSSSSSEGMSGEGVQTLLKVKNERE